MKIKIKKKDFRCEIENIYKIQINEFDFYHCFFDYLFENIDISHDYIIESDSFSKKRDTLIIKPDKITSEVLFSDETKDIIQYKFLIKFKLNGKNRRKTITYRHKKLSNKWFFYKEIIDDINDELSSLSLSKYDIKTIRDLKNLEKLLYNINIKKIISKSKRKEKLKRLNDIIEEKNNKKINNLKN